MDTTHLHLLLNHVPTIGFVVALGFYIVSFIGKSDHLKQASLVLMVGVAFITIPTYVTGNAAWNHIQNMDEMHQTAAETHEGAAFLALVAIQKGDIPTAIKHLEKATTTGNDAADQAMAKAMLDQLKK